MTALSIPSLASALLIILGPAATSAGAATTGRSEERRTGRTAAVAVIRDIHGTQVGSARLIQEAPRKTVVSVRAGKLSPGAHGLHVHAKGACDAAARDSKTGKRAPFSTAGGHHNPGRANHGHHAGDLPLLFAGADGRATVRFTTDRFTVRELLDRDGSAIVVHRSPDNYGHIPDRYTHPHDATGTTGPDAVTGETGDAGDRIACGVLRAR
jgi:superoxide dismutase, Cu-Zn family